MGQSDTTTPPGGMTFFFGQPVEYRTGHWLRDSTNPERDHDLTWCPAVIIRPFQDEDDELALAYHHPVAGYQWTDRAERKDVRLPFGNTTLGDHGWRPPAAVKELTDRIDKLRAALRLINDPARTALPKWVREYITKTLGSAGDRPPVTDDEMMDCYQFGKVDSEKLRLRDIQIEQLEETVDGLRAALACTNTPVSQVPFWAHNCAGSIIRICEWMKRQYGPGRDRVVFELDTIIDLAKLIRREDQEPTHPPPPDIEPDLPF